MEILFWIAASILIYTYLGYGAIMALISRIKGGRKIESADSVDKSITVIVAAFNEQDVIEEKIQNTFSLDYPAHLLEMIVITDGSSDQTASLVSRYPQVRHFHRPDRRGKVNAINRIISEVKNEIVVLTDANAMLNQDALKLMSRHFNDVKVGAVAGEKRIESAAEADAAAAEGLYWKYESWLKKMDAEVNTLVGAAGELFALRASLFEKVEEDILIEDFVASMRIVEKGFRVAYEPEAVASESGSISTEEELKRKIRISAGGLQASWRLRHLLNPFKFGFTAFQLFSHRVLRWTAAPVMLAVALFSNAVIAAESLIYQSFFGLQVCFYLLSFIGYYLEKNNIKTKGLLTPFYFTMMNLSVFQGLVRLIRNQQSVVWEKSIRA